MGEETNVEPRTTQNEEINKNRNEIIIYGMGIISLGLIIIFIIFIIKKGEKMKINNKLFLLEWHLFCHH